MKRAALLIDWENFAAKVSRAPYWIKDVGPEVEKLVAAIEDHATGQGANLLQKHYFHGVKTDVGEAKRVLQNLGFRVGIGTEAKNAADTLLIVEATRQQAIAKVDIFYVVTGDEDFADLGHALEGAEGICFLCPTDRSQLRGPIKSWRHKLFVDKAAGETGAPGLIDLPRNSPPEASEMDQLIISLQGLVDGGRHLGNWPNVVGWLAELGVFGASDSVRTLMNKADADNFFVMQDLELCGRRVRHRRLRYEHPRVMRMFTAADLMLEEARRKKGDATRGDLINIVAADAQRDFPALPEMLRLAGYLHAVGERLTIDSDRSDFGILRALARMALTVWHTSLNAQRPGVDENKIHERWVRHATGGRRDVPQDQIDAALAQGRRMVARARAAGVIEFAPQDRNRRDRYVVRDDHPIVEQVVAVARFVWERTPREPDSIGRDELAEKMEAGTTTVPALGVTARDHREWLGALAGAGVIHLAQGRATRARASKLQDMWP